MKFIKKPNLPENRVVSVAISCEAGEAIQKLDSLGIETIKIPISKWLATPVRSHADMQILHIGNNTIFCQNEHLCTGELFGKFEMVPISQKLSKNYPGDVPLNCAVVGKRIICNIKTTASEVLEFAYKSGLEIINVNQGYSKCSICIVNENAIITDDESIFAATGKFLNDVLFVSKGSVALKGYNYGFIGGCCGKIDNNELAFNGRLESHNDFNKILDFLVRNNVKCVELTNNRLSDIGSIIPLCQTD